MQHTKLRQLVKDYLLYIEACGKVEEKGTVDFQRKRMRLFVEYVEEKEIADPLTVQTFQRYAVHLKDRKKERRGSGKLAPLTRRGYLQVLKRFAAWLHLAGHTERDLSETISLPGKLRLYAEKAITPDDMTKLLQGCQTPRDRALLLMLRDTGCRSCEMIGMRWQDVDEDKRRVWVTGKRDKSRWVFFTPHTLDELRPYRETVPHEPADPVWWGDVGRDNQSPLKYRGLHSLLRRLSARLDVSGQHNPHAFRHAFGKRMNKSGVSTLVLQELMGHSSPEVTKIYAGGLEPDELGGLYDRFNPFAQEPASAD